MDDTALSYAEIKALATGNPYIKEKMDLDIQVSKLKLLKANHTSQVYSLESDIARRYPREITAAKGQIEALKNDMEAAKPLLAQDKDHFAMEISGKVYSERKEAGAAIIEACKALKAAGTEGRIGSYGAFELHSRFDSFDKVFRLSIKGAWNYSMEVGKDPQGNILRVTNALSGIERALPQVERRLETLEQQLAQAKEEAKRPFVQEAELAEKSARLAELNSLLNIHQRFLQVLQIVFGKVVLVSSLAVDWPFGVGLRLYIGFAQAVDYDVGMDVACSIIAICMGADQSLMPRKISFCVFQPDGLCTFSC